MRQFLSHEDYDPELSCQPLQIYNSLLIFSPIDSLIRSEFQKDIPTCFKHVWGLGGFPSTYEKHSSKVVSVAFSSDASLLASGSDDSTVKVWDTETGRCLHTLTGHSLRVNTVALSPNSSRLASGSSVGTIRIWDPVTGRCLHTLNEHTKRVNMVAFSPDSSQLASGSKDNTVKVWDTETGRCLHTLGDNTVSGNGRDGQYWVVFSPDSNLLVSLAEFEVSVWDLSTRRCRHAFDSGFDSPGPAAFLPDSSGVALVLTETRDIQVWDLATGRCLQTIEFAPNDPLFKDISFDSTGTYLYTDKGTYELGIPSASNQGTITRKARRKGFGISKYSKFIMRDVEYLSDLSPIYSNPEYGGIENIWPQRKTAVRKSKIAIGCGSGHVLIFDFEE